MTVNGFRLRQEIEQGESGDSAPPAWCADGWLILPDDAAGIAFHRKLFKRLVSGCCSAKQSRRIIAAALPGAVLPACSAQPFMRAGIRSAAGRAAHTEYDSGTREDQWASSASTLAIGSNSAPILVSRPASPPVSRIWPLARVVSPSTCYVPRTLSIYEAR